MKYVMRIFQLGHRIFSTGRRRWWRHIGHIAIDGIEIFHRRSITVSEAFRLLQFLAFHSLLLVGFLVLLLVHLGRVLLVHLLSSGCGLIILVFIGVLFWLLFLFVAAAVIRLLLRFRRLFATLAAIVVTFFVSRRWVRWLRSTQFGSEEAVWR